MNQGPDFTQEDKQQMNKLFKPLETTYQTFSSHLLAFNKAIEASKGCQWSPWGLIRLSPPMYEGVLQFIDAIQNFCAQYRPIIEAASKSESTDQSAIYFLKK